MGNLQIVTSLNQKMWNDFVYHHPKGNIFQTLQMYEVYKNTKNWEPVFLAVIDNNDNVLGTLLAVIQKEWEGFLDNITARAIVWGGPLVKEGERDRDVMHLLLDALDGKLRGRVLYIQFRNLWGFANDKGCFTNGEYIYKEHLNFVLSLNGNEEKLWGKLFPSKRNKVRKAYKIGVKIKFASSNAEINKSYLILKGVYKRIKMPMPHRTLFEAMYDILLPHNMLKVFLAVYNNILIGVLYLLVYKEQLYVWYAGGSSSFYDKHPNDILYWEAIKWGCDHEAKIFDFGGAGTPNREYGVREFKKEFGGEMVNYGRFEKIYHQKIFKIVKIGLRLRKKT